MNENCSECGESLPLRVLQSAAGYYVGYFCPNCGPYKRFTNYTRTKDASEAILETMKMTLEEKLKFTRKKVETLYINTLTREEILAYALNHKGITAEDLILMQDDLPLGKMAIFSISHHLLSLENKEKGEKNESRG